MIQDRISDNLENAVPDSKSLQLFNDVLNVSYHPQKEDVMTQPSSSIEPFTEEVFVSDSERRLFNEKSIEISKTLFKEVLSETSKKNYNILLGASLACVLLWLGVKIENISALAALKELSIPVIRYAAALSTIYFLLIFLISITQDWQIYSYEISKNREELSAFMTTLSNRAIELALKNLRLHREIKMFFLNEIGKLDKNVKI